ncbi:hypothetical protein [Paenibacillus arenilitoris]|uniref:Uncharacterized protein n=1 Tax=Paenibacillus arenilitoris TaxID=2772299 RepID=A0A927H5Q3_9BACL|nr:hypothetical protein [Paenibacillus arenilitoris]MBD2869701.1 hypothetical protein [Paenibacillus arenilitoris]
MRKPRVIPVLITAAVAASLLFGGWAVYNQVAVAAPLEKVAKEAEGVASSAKPVMDDKQVTIDVVLEPDANIRDVYERIAANGKELFGGRKLNLNVKSESSKELDELWSSSLFVVAEAMETKAYSNIPAALKEAAKGYDGVTVSTEMDETNVYVTLKKADTAKYIVLPRTPAQLEVW